MRALPAALLASTLLAGLLAGCVSESPATDDPCVATDGAPLGPCGDPVALTTTAPKLDARKVLDDLRAFSEAYPYRQAGTQSHLDARDDLAARFAAAGLEVVRQPFPSAGTSTIGGPFPSFDGENVIGIKWGVDREHWVVVGSHYDVTEGAIYGTYDDGSGTALNFELADAFKGVTTQRTIVFAEFDQEELGLVGSSFFLQSLEEGTFAYTGTVDAMLDLDMLGITYPHPAKLVVWQNSEVLKQRLLDAAAAHTAMPADHFDFREPLGGSSDGAAFIAAGIPTAYLWSDWDEYIGPDGNPMPYVGLYVGAYPWWHKMDTYDTMVLSAGDEATLQAGFQTVVDLVSPFLLETANGPAPDVVQE